MKITNVESRLLYVPFTRPQVWASGARPGSTRLLITLHTDDGLTGYGETICLHEFIQPVVERTIAPLVIGHDPHDIERLHRKIDGAGYYHHQRAAVAALAGVELAMWDLIGKSAGKPLYQLWGGGFRRLIPTIAYLHARPPAELAAEAAEFVANGWQTIKVKIGLDPKTDIAAMRAVRDAIGPDVLLRGDVNGAWTPGTARRQLAKLAELDLEFVEQPLMLDDLIGHAQLRRGSQVPICIDEGAFTNTDVLNIIRLEAADVILVDAHEAGGWCQARKQAAIAEAAGIPVGIHSGGELGLSLAANLHLAAATPNLSLAIDSNYHGMPDDIITERFVYQKGALAVPERPGLGVEIDWDKVDRYTTDHIHDAYINRDRPDWFTMKPAY
ncbi:MAG: mandelate racemase/muconate lactonizing enzyme family protein [Chloroflexia bacterium]|nr:mandelate racemase/muconate lactonizing enzyme family protein [Chloroflexia bacterium]